MDERDLEIENQELKELIMGLNRMLAVLITKHGTQGALRISCLEMLTAGDAQVQIRPEGQGNVQLRIKDGSQFFDKPLMEGTPS